MKTYKKGISLIVLVITVIVLSILASAVIISVNNTNIMNEADSAVKQYNKKQYEQQLTLAYASWLAENRGATFTASNISELEEHGFKVSTLPAGYTLAVENKIPVLIEADVWDGTTVSSVDFTASVVEINTAEDLAALAVYVNQGNSMYGQTIELMTNIDLANKPWTPIGTSVENYFAGDFYGNNKTIYNINVSGVEYAGLFGYFGSIDVQDGIITNLNVNGGLVSGRYAGAIAGNVSYCASIENCINYYVEVSGTSDAGGIACGGIGGSVNNCKNYGNVTCTGENSYSIAAGIFTIADGTSMNNCVNYGNVTCNNGYASGITQNSSGISNCKNYGDIVGKTASGIICYINISSITNCINEGNITGTETAGSITCLTPEEAQLAGVSWSGNVNTGTVTAPTVYTTGL